MNGGVVYVCKVDFERWELVFEFLNEGNVGDGFCKLDYDMFEFVSDVNGDYCCVLKEGVLSVVFEFGWLVFLSKSWRL